MAIFAGNWKDAEGVPFCANAYQKEDYGASGSAQGNSRGGWGSARQRHAVVMFMRAAWHWSNALTDEQRAMWVDMSQRRAWYYRRYVPPTTFYGRGYLSFLQGAVSAYGGEVLVQDEPGWAMSGDTIDACWYEDGKIWVTFYNQWRIDVPDSFANVFQVNPKYMWKDYLRQETRDLGIVYHWQYQDYEYTTFSWKPAWPVRGWPGGRVFIRAWRGYEGSPGVLQNWDEVVWIGPP